MRFRIVVFLATAVSAVTTILLFGFVHKRPTVVLPTRQSKPPYGLAAKVHQKPLDNGDLYHVYLDRTIVMGRRPTDDSRWIERELPEWRRAVYTIEDNNSTTTTTITTSQMRTDRGHEALPYLQYIVDNYPNLPSIMVFIHSKKNGAPGTLHADDPEHDVVQSLKALRLNYVRKEGYVSLRCNPYPGCPDEVQPYRKDPSRQAEMHMVEVWHELFGREGEPPKVIAAAHGSQFAVSKAAVLKTPLEDYQRYLHWLTTTSLDSETTGRIMEYLWHIIFGKAPVFCPDIEACYFQVYGWL